MFQDEIIEWITLGRPLREYCRLPGKPKWRAVYHWLDKDPTFATHFALARERGADAIAEQTLEIADDGTNDTYTDEQGRVRVDQDVVARSRLRVETRLKLLAKWFPHRYGERQQVEHAGGITLQVVTGVTDS